MDNINSLFLSSIPPGPSSNPCEPISAAGNSAKGPLNFGVSVFAPVSSVTGSSSFFFLQPLLAGKVFASVGILIATQIFLLLSNRFFGHGLMSVQQGPSISPEQTVRMSLSDLENFLNSVSRSEVQPSIDQVVSGELTPETAEIPLVFSLAVWGDFANEPYGPSIFLLFPMFSFPGVRGALPLLILELLTTIFVRAVVPPQTTGSKPMTDPTIKSELESPEFSQDDLLTLLNRFSKHFRP